MSIYRKKINCNERYGFLGLIAEEIGNEYLDSETLRARITYISDRPSMRGENREDIHQCVVYLFVSCKI